VVRVIRVGRVLRVVRVVRVVRVRVELCVGWFCFGFFFFFFVVGVCVWFTHQGREAEEGWVC
jgi:hypothetical protein